LLLVGPRRDHGTGKVHFHLKILKFVGGLVDDIARSEEGSIESLYPSEIRKGPPADKKKLKDLK